MYCNRDMPNCMVTHSWDAPFLHLVASVVAEALGFQAYVHIADQLSNFSDEGRIAITRALEAKKTLNRRYWICCFCVNQHTCICSSFGREPLQTAERARWNAACRDPVSKKLLDTCNCQTPKYFNDSDKCE